ncbi:unnamed protein product [Vitrella brassicaformis CCMP3155]|uniref:Uncharacterized protein n=1 Tax=Vitrella brassicaformis (strain CCMP3155) TaxID=1169540 RepID=A0A0G4H7B1_VITBC|nr:unnamed protein product [Vitrella brassicaformis CCMP3155]|eukprot:CEM39630.1 unnamed protein product [Vitrella brassicaformis CCMP3155]
MRLSSPALMPKSTPSMQLPAPTSCPAAIRRPPSGGHTSAPATATTDESVRGESGESSVVPLDVRRNRGGKMKNKLRRMERRRRKQQMEQLRKDKKEDFVPEIYLVDKGKKPEKIPPTGYVLPRGLRFS